MNTGSAGGLQITIGSDVDAPGAARAALGRLQPPLGESFDDAMLIVTELVTNAVLHGPRDGPVVISAAVEGGRLHVEVADEGSCFEAADLASTGPEARGLRIVTALSAAWGVSKNHGCRVWADLDLPT